MLGWIPTKTGSREKVDNIKQDIREAVKNYLADFVR